MAGRRVLSVLKNRPAAPKPPPEPAPQPSAPADEGRSKSWGRRIVSGALLCLTGGVALSALDDLVIYQGCSSKAMEKASKNKAIIDAIGEPIVRGPWYNASLAVAHKRHSVSCTFPVSGPQGSGIFQLKAVCNEDQGLFSILRARDWEILIMEALLHVPGNDEKERTFRINISDDPPLECKSCVAACPSTPTLNCHPLLRTINRSFLSRFLSVNNSFIFSLFQSVTMLSSLKSQCSIILLLGF
ncbi:uncharacterized protein LOC125200419 isoform X1 [Salvia hispanica]|uniref:uncharacterized protein LOC125200419 isoform X1 n=1 Tax=Salvia hispanica TaxID=49212 RepID=UPI0020094A84|nr:uncharacterized protein LOC125200419 isoform X1 [Salvia hispanica]